MRISARGDYAIRAAIELAANQENWLKVDELARAQQIPPRFLENILVALRNAGLAQSRRGATGGYRLARDPAQVTLADVIRATEGPLAAVQGVRPESVEAAGAAAPMREVWVAVRASLREVLETVTLADVASGQLPPAVTERLDSDAAWDPH